MRLSRSAKTYFSVGTIGLVVILAFQNCGQNFDVGGNASSKMADNGGGGGIIWTAEEVQSACEGGAGKVVQTATVLVSIPDPGQCAWGQSGNKNFRFSGEAEVRARHEQRVDITQVPVGAKICDMDFQFNTAHFIYDDQLIFHMNEMIFASTDKSLVQKFPQVAGIHRYDWNTIRGIYSDPIAYDVWCIGAGGACQIPVTETVGQINIKVPKTSIHQMSAAIPADQGLRFTVVTTGDNDETIDCRHSALDFSLVIKYVQ